jgi:tripartite-type tricarboxylate transporter receptor subunit TctC
LAVKYQQSSAYSPTPIRTCSLAACGRSPSRLRNETCFCPTCRRLGEAGYPSLEAVEWFGLFVPGKTSADIVKTLNASVQQALHTDAVKSGLAKQAFDVAGTTPNEFMALIKADTKRWGEVVKASGFNPIE